MVVFYYDQPIGGGALREYDNDSVELKRLFVNPQWQGKGIGTELVLKLIE